MNKPATPNSFRTGPDEQGMFGIFGGRFVAETLMPLILELEHHWHEAKNDPAFKADRLAGLMLARSPLGPDARRINDFLNGPPP